MYSLPFVSVFSLPFFSSFLASCRMRAPGSCWRNRASTWCASASRSRPSCPRPFSASTVRVTTRPHVNNGMAHTYARTQKMHAHNRDKGCRKARDAPGAHLLVRFAHTLLSAFCFPLTCSTDVSFRYHDKADWLFEHLDLGVDMDTRCVLGGLGGAE